MKRFFDVYLRPADLMLETLSLDGNGEPDGWDKLALPGAGVKFSIEPVLVDAKDGTSYTMGEKMSLEAISFEAGEAGWDALGAYHNQLCDALLYDPEQAEILAIGYALRMIRSTGEDNSVRLYGSRADTTDAGNMLVILPGEAVLREIKITADLDGFTGWMWNPGDSQSYLLEGVRLQYPLRLAALAGYEYSTDNINYFEELALDPDWSGLIYVRLTGSEAGDFAGVISHSSWGVTSQDLNVSGICAARQMEMKVLSPAAAIRNTASMASSVLIPAAVIRQTVGLGMSVPTPEEVQQMFEIEKQTPAPATRQAANGCGMSVPTPEDV